MRVNLINLVMEQLHLVGDGKVPVFLLIQTSICHINTLHNCYGSLYSPNPQVLAVPVAHIWPVRGVNKRL